MHKTIFCLIIIFSAFFGFSQTETQNDDCEYLFESLKWVFTEGALDDEEVINNSDQWLSLSRSKNCEALPLALNLSGFKAYRQNNIPAATAKLLEAEQLFNKEASSSFQVDNQIYLGLVNILQKNSSNAIHYFTRAEELSKEIDYAHGLNSAIQNLGLTHLENGNHESAKKYLLLSKDAMHADSSTEGLGYTLLNLSRVSFQQNDLQQATTYLKQSKNIWQDLGHLRGLYYLTFIEAKIHVAKNQNKLAIKEYLKGLTLAERIDVKIEKGAAYLNLAEAYERINKRDSARINYELAIKNGTTFTTTDLQKVVTRLQTIYKEDKNPEKFNSLIAAVLNLYSSNQKLKDLESEKWVASELTLENVKGENQKLSTSNEQKNKRLRGQLWILFGLAIGVLLTGLALFTISRKNRENKVLLAKLESQNKQLENFAYLASHDLRSPLNTIRSFSGLIKRRVSDVKDEKLNNMLSFVESASAGMAALIDDLLSMARLENDALRITELDINQLINDVLLNLDAEINSKSAIIKTSKFPSELKGDEIKIKRLFLNLISNALKFNASDRKLSIRIDYRQSKEEHVFSVADNGLGINKENRESIFQLFKKSIAQENNTGTGIGLAVCSKIAELHKGRIWVESEEGQGSTFYFSISKFLNPD